MKKLFTTAVLLSLVLGAFSTVRPQANRNPDDAGDGTGETALTGIYKIGVGDVLDIRLLNSSTPRSTLYTVLEGGLIDLAVAGGPIAVSGLTVDEVQSLLVSEL